MKVRQMLTRTTDREVQSTVEKWIRKQFRRIYAELKNYWQGSEEHRGEMDPQATQKYLHRNKQLLKRQWRIPCKKLSVQQFWDIYIELMNYWQGNAEHCGKMDLQVSQEYLHRTKELLEIRQCRKPCKKESVSNSRVSTRQESEEHRGKMEL